MIPRSLRKAFLGCKTGWRLGENVYHKGPETVYNGKFSKVIALRKKRSKAYTLEEPGLKFRAAEGNAKVVFVTYPYWFIELDALFPRAL